MAFLLNVFSYAFSGFQLEKMILNIPYKQMTFLQNEFSYVPSGFQLEKKP